MPTNVTVEYTTAEQEYSRAKTTSEKISALQKMLSNAPTHKGAEKLRQEIKTKLAKLKDKVRKEQERKSKGKSLSIKKEGAATLVLVGPTNSGKSLLLNKLTNRKVEIGNYPFTTMGPEVGIMKYKGLKIQVIEVPAIFEGFYNKDKGPELMSIVRNADLVVIVTDIADIDFLFKEFNDAGIKFNEDFVEDDFVNMKAVIIANKDDLNDFNDVYRGLCRYYNFDVITFSGLHGDIEALKERLWKHLGLIKIYTKEPGKKAKIDEPICLNEGATIEDMAKRLHKDFIKKFKFARVWGKSAKFGGQMCGLKHILEDEDVVEVHLK